MRQRRASKTAKTKTPRTGKRTRYRAEWHTKLAGAWARAGLTDLEIANELGISEKTYYRWKNDHPEFAKAIDDGKDLPNRRVEAALFSAALGYDYDAEKPMVVGTGKGFSAIEIAQYREHVPANVTAMIFWLKNRDPQHWRDKQEVEHSGSITLSIDAEDAEL